MSVLFKLHKIVRTFKDQRTDMANNKWFARAITVGTLNTQSIAEIIQRNCSMKKSDVRAVLDELVEVMTDKLQESYAVKLDGLGIFKIGLQSTGADSVGEFSVNSNIVGAHVNFQPTFTVNAATGKRTQALLEGVTFQETAKNDVVKA